MLARVKSLIAFPLGRAILNAQSTKAWIKSFGKKSIVHFAASYGGSPILFLALYQKGRLRPDVIRMLDLAKQQGFYILAVNTLKLRLAEIERARGHVDCYIERPNFGRDFGSYKTGFLHLFDQGWAQNCPRLIMLNDSVFYSTPRVAKFLNDLADTDTEVLGATENFEIEHHLGSFAIAFGGAILRNPLFARYWRDYNLTDVRPAVIRTGEMALSKLLKRCVAESSQFRALYSTTRYVDEVERNRELLEFSVSNARTSSLTHWQRVTPKGMLDYLSVRYLVPVHAENAGSVQVDANLTELNERSFIVGYQDLEEYIRQKVADDAVVDSKRLSSLAAAYLGEIFMQGSQIHQNAAILLYMGLPIIKLDGLYRGMFNTFDIGTLARQLDDQEAAELRELLYARPYGENVLSGWKKAAFMRGYL